MDDSPSSITPGNPHARKPTRMLWIKIVLIAWFALEFVFNIARLTQKGGGALYGAVLLAIYGGLIALVVLL